MRWATPTDVLLEAIDMFIIYDYVLEKQPDVFRLLKQLFGVRKPRLRKVEGMKARLWCGDDEFDFYAVMMREPPKGGRAGLLPGEKGVV